MFTQACVRRPGRIEEIFNLVDSLVGIMVANLNEIAREL
jgi:hypothetical protein